MAANAPTAGAPDLLELWAISWSFSQHELLSADQFERECSARGLSLRPGQLEALDRLGVLRPAFEIAAALAADRWQPGSRRMREAVLADEIRNRLREPKADWPKSWDAPVAVRYSWYQLLAVPILDQFLNRLKLDEDSDLRKGRYVWRYSDEDMKWLALHELPILAEKLIVWLSVLEPVFLPSVVRQASLPMLTELPEDRPYAPDEITKLDEEYRGAFEWYRRAVPMADLHAHTGATLEELADQIQKLFFMADDVDPLGEWLQVIRLAPLRWKYLRREALVAMDHRIAGEVLLRFLNRLADDGLADAGVYGRDGALAQRFAERRLYADESKLEGVLVDFDLSPFPVAIVVLEGKTESTLAPLIIDALGLPRPPYPVRLHDGKSTDAPLIRMFRYAWEFEIHEEIYGGFRPSRPLPHLFALSDPEGTRETEAGREKLRKKIVALLKEDAEAIAGRPLPDDLFDSRIEVRAWPQSFEFAHFNLNELAAALRALEPALDQGLEAALANVASRTSPRIDAVWQELRRAGLVHRDLDKLALAKALWPTLQQKVRSAADEQELRQIPLVAALLDAYDPVYQNPWGHFSFIPAGKPATRAKP